MVLYACASYVLGWTGMTNLAQSSLHARGLAGGISLSLRALVTLVCVLGALAAWFLLDGLVCCLAFSFACACMGALLVCDLCEHILPTELVAGLLVFALVFRVTASEVGGAFAIALPAGLIAGSLLLVNHLRAHRGAAEVIGSGDVRMIVPLALFSGIDGVIAGVFACAVLMGALALVQLVCGKARRDTHIALAPGLVAWLFTGTLLPLL